MSKPWWKEWDVAELSPLNPLAVVAAQLDPPDWEEAWQQAHADGSYAHGSYQFTQLWWLCWYARPDRRAQMLRGADFSLYCRRLPVVVHPDTIAEWSEPPRWADGGLWQQERNVRCSVLKFIPLTVDQCRHIYPPTWDVVSLAFQAGRSEAHGNVLLTQLRSWPPPRASSCLYWYLIKKGVKKGACWQYLKAFHDIAETGPL